MILPFFSEANMKKIGIIIADADEFAPFEKLISKDVTAAETFLKRKKLIFNVGGAQVIALHCGIGKVNAAAAAAHLADCGCAAIVNFGLSGGISGVCRGETVLCTEFLEHDFDLSGIGYKPFEKPGQEYVYRADEKLCGIVRKLVPGIKEGTAVTGDCFVNDAAKRKFLKDEFSAMCCDMETAAVAYVCRFSDIPFVCVRKISDDAGNDAIDSHREMNTLGETDLARLCLEITSAVAEND